MPEELNSQVKKDVEEAIGRSEGRFALRKLVALLTFAFVAYKIIKKVKKGGREEAMSGNKNHPVSPPDA